MAELLQVIPKVFNTKLMQKIQEHVEGTKRIPHIQFPDTHFRITDLQSWSFKIDFVLNF